MPATHYQRLGVAPSASTEEIRTAYRALARRLHPDRLGDTSGPERDHAERRMREINESWAVLGDAAARRRYDEDRRQGPRPTTTRPRSRSAAVTPADQDDDLVDVLPALGRVGAGAMRHGPWLVALLVLGLIFVVSAYAGKDDEPAPTGTARSVQAGECLDTPTGISIRVVPCDGPHEYQLVVQAVTPDLCPDGTEALLLDDGDDLWDCVR